MKPQPSPTTTPHSSTSCHVSDISGVSATPVAVAVSDSVTVRRTPNRSISAAANGPIAPYSSTLTPTANEIVARDQWNSCSSGTISTPGAARTPAVSTTMTKVIAATIQA